MAVTAKPEISKILLDLGIEPIDVYAVDNAEKTYISALIEGINTLEIANKGDSPRSRILRDELKRVRERRRGPKTTTKTIDKNKLLNRIAPSNQKVSPQKLLPAASEEGGAKDQTIITSNLAERLGNIQDALKTLGIGFTRQLRLDKRVAEADARNAKELAKLEKEKKLEKKKTNKITGLGFKKLSKPVVGFFDTLINFFKNIFIGSALLGILNWVTDPNNKQRVEEFGKFFTEKAPWIVGGIAALTAISLMAPILGLGQVLWWGGGLLVGALVALKSGLVGAIGGLLGKGKSLIKGFSSPIKRKVKVTKGNWFTRGLKKINPFKGKPGVSKGSNWFSRTGSKLFGGKKVTGLKPRGIGGIKPGGIPVVGALLSLWDFGSRKAEGQTNIQAASGVGGGWMGALAATALAGVLIPEPATSVAGGITLAILGTLGYNVGGMISDSLTGVNAEVAKVSPKTPNLTSDTGTGNIQLLNLGGGGAAAPVTGGGESEGGDETLPSFNSSDPHNMSTLAVRSVYGLVN